MATAERLQAEAEVYALLEAGRLREAVEAMVHKQVPRGGAAS